MDSNKNHIDNFLKEKLEDWPVELNEAHWADAERRLDEEDNRKKPFFFIFLLGVLLIGLGTAAYKQFSSSKKSQPLAQTEVSKENNFKIATTNKNNYEEFSEKNVDRGIESIAKNTTSNLDNKSAQELNRVPSDKNITVGEPNKLQRNRKANNLVALKSNTNSTEQKLDGIIRNPKSAEVSSRKLIAPPNKKEEQPSKKTTTLAATKENKISEPRVIKSETNPQTSLTRSEIVAHKKTNKNVATSTNNKESKSSGWLASATGVVKSKNSSKITIYKSAAEFQEMNPRYVKGLENYNYEVTNIELGPKKSDSIRKVVAQQIKPKTVANYQQESKALVRQPSRFFILAGIAAARGYRGNLDANPSYGLSPSLGAGYQYNFTDRMSLYLSVYMSYIGNLNIKETRTQYSYSFDRDSTLLSVTRKNLLQLQLPVQVAYKLNRKHSVFGGIGTSLGINTISLYEDSKNSGSKKQFGYTDGLRFFDFNASLGYEYHISPKFSAGIFYQQGFLDMTKNNYFTNQHFDRNSRGGINLRYKF